jgi:hydroxymethylpyrimidine pyrophosphatase-like HAD family hydrolase
LSEVGGQIAMHRTEYAARNLSILDLLPLGCSKGAALDSLARIRGLERDEIMAIGDNLNDLEMLEYAGRAVVMANASEEIRALARRRGWELTASNDDDGVARAIEEVLRRQGLPQVTNHNGEETIASSPVVQFAQ